MEDYDKCADCARAKLNNKGYGRCLCSKNASKLHLLRIAATRPACEHFVPRGLSAVPGFFTNNIQPI